MSVPALELRAIESLIPYARNSNTHPKSQLIKIEAAMEEFGWTNPVLIDENGGIVAGHGRVMTAERIYKRGGVIRFPNGEEIPPGKVPVLSCAGWSEQQKRAYVMADNRLAQDSVLDIETAALEMHDLKLEGYDLALTGFDDDEVAAMLAALVPAPDPAGDPDDAPAVPEFPLSRTGDVWVMGAHRLCVGDSTDPAAWDALMQGELADAVWTDPPYNVNQGRKNREQDKWDGGSRSDTGGIDNDKMSPAEFLAFLQAAFGMLIENMKPGAPIYVAHADIEGANFRNAMAAAGLKIQSCLIWRKNTMVLGRMDWQSIHEPILYAWKPGSRHRWYGGRKNTSVIDLGEGSPFTRMEDGRYQVKVGDAVLVVSADAMVEEHPSSVLYEPRPAKSGLHPTQKPVALVERMLKQSARAGDIIVDAFGGSGSTLIAADRLGMCARLMEKDEGFADVIVRRWQQYTGRRAVHAVTGEPFPDEDGAREPQPEPAPAGEDLEVF